MKIHVLFRLVVCGVLVGVLGSTAEVRAAKKDSRQPVKIGVLVSLTGSWSTLGKNTVAALQIAANQIAAQTHGRQRFENLEIAIGSANLKGRLDREAQANQPPKLAVDLAGDTLDLDALRALTSLFTGQEAGDNVLDHRISAHLKADKFSAFGVQAENVETAFGIADGSLQLCGRKQPAHVALPGFRAQRSAGNRRYFALDPVDAVKNSAKCRENHDQNDSADDEQSFAAAGRLWQLCDGRLSSGLLRWGLWNLGMLNQGRLIRSWLR